MFKMFTIFAGLTTGFVVLKYYNSRSNRYNVYYPFALIGIGVGPHKKSMFEGYDVQNKETKDHT